MIDYQTHSWYFYIEIIKRLLGSLLEFFEDFFEVHENKSG